MSTQTFRKGRLCKFVLIDLLQTQKLFSYILQNTITAILVKKREKGHPFQYIQFNSIYWSKDAINSILIFIYFASTYLTTI